jgi:replicative DNA helicase
VGKTGFVLSIARHAAVRHHLPVAIFSLEMSVEQLVQRLLCSEANVDAERLRTGFIDEYEWRRISEAFGVLAQAPIFIDDTANISIMEMRLKARRLMAEQDLKLIIVDYLQLMQGRGLENRVQEVSEISRGLKALARELNVPVIALSQLSRAVEARQDHRPVLSDLRESGSIEQDADIVMFIHREEIYNPNTERKNIADIIIAKHRNGPTGQIPLRFFPSQIRFADLELYRQPEE